MISFNRLLVVGSAAAAGVAAFCSSRRRSHTMGNAMSDKDSEREFVAPPSTAPAAHGKSAALPTYRPSRWDAGVARTEGDAVRQRHERDLMTTAGVLGTGLGRAPDGREALLVYVQDSEVGERLPRTLDGVPVEAIVTGPIYAR